MPSAMEPQERDFWLAVTLWGAALVTVLGCGLFAFIESSPGFGIFYTVVGLGGLVYMTLRLRGHRLSLNPAFVVAMLALTWVFFGYSIWFAPKPELASDRAWPPLTNNELASLERALSALPKHRPMRVFCLSADCKGLSNSFVSAFYTVGWQPVVASSSTYNEQVGLVLYLKDANDRTLADAIERATKLKIERVEATADPNLESLFVGIKP